MDTLSLCAAAMITALLALTLERFQREYALAVTLVGALLLLSTALPRAAELFRYLYDLAEAGGLPPDRLEPLVKALGLCLVTELAGESCRDAGARALAAGVELAGKLSVLWVALPLFAELIGLFSTLLV